MDQRIPVVCGGIRIIPDIRKQDIRIQDIIRLRNDTALVPVIRKYGSRISDTIRKEQDVRIPDIRNISNTAQFDQRGSYTKLLRWS